MTNAGEGSRRNLLSIVRSPFFLTLLQSVLASGTLP